MEAGLVGRVAMCTPMGPHIVPVNYSVVDQSVIVRTTPYSVLGSHAQGAILALEVDQFDYERHRGWSVVARGRADVVTGADDLEEIKGRWEPRTWAARIPQPFPPHPLERAVRAPTGCRLASSRRAAGAPRALKC